MQQNSELLETGLIEEFKAKKQQTIQDIMNDFDYEKLRKEKLGY